MIYFSYDVMFLGNLDEIVKKFKSFPDTRVLFSAEQFCWPDAKLATQYPNIEVVSPYLNSGGFIGKIDICVLSDNIDLFPAAGRYFEFIHITFISFVFVEQVTCQKYMRLSIATQSRIRMMINCTTQRYILIRI